LSIEEELRGDRPFTLKGLREKKGPKKKKKKEKFMERTIYIERPGARHLFKKWGGGSSQGRGMKPTTRF